MELKEGYQTEIAVLFEGNDIKLTKIAGKLPVAIVTFNCFTITKNPITPTEFEPGFASGLFAVDGFAEYHVVTNKNDWFQSKEMDDVLEIICTDAVDCKQIVTYGSSMGGSGAINYSAKLNAVFVAFAPQYSIYPNEINGDTRWLFESTKIKRLHNYILEGMCAESEGFLFYDSLSEDKIHADLIKNNTHATLMDVPYGGHLLGDVINDIYGIKRIVEEVALNKFSSENFYKEVEKSRDSSIAYSIKRLNYIAKRNPSEIEKDDINKIAFTERLLRNTGLCLAYLDTLLLVKEDIQEFVNAMLTYDCNEEMERYIYVTERLMDYRQYDLARKILKTGTDKYESARLFYDFSVVLYNVGEVDEALTMINKAILMDESAEYYYYLGELLMVKQNYNLAEEAFLKAIDRNDSIYYYYSRLSGLYYSTERNDLAIKMMNKALELNSSNMDCLKLLGMYLEHGGEFQKACDVYKRILDLKEMIE